MSSKQDKNHIKEKNLRLFDKIIELRKFEIENFWKRTLFFWGTIAIIYAGYFKADITYEYKIIVPLIGLLFNIIFSLSTRGSKYWQEHWEMMAFEYEDVNNITLFNGDQRETIDNNNKSVFTRPYRFSVSKLTMLLSDLSTLIWLILWIKEIIFLIKKNYLKFDCFPTMIDWYTIGIISIHMLLIGYFVSFLKFGKVYYSFKEGNNKENNTASNENGNVDNY